MLSWLDFEGLHFRGASVTIPHKANLLRFVEEQGGEVEPLAAAIGAANTLTKREDGCLYASNTDYAALLDAVCDAWGVERGALSGRRVAVLGAGGAARAAVAGFTDAGCGVTVFNRTADKAAALAARFGATSAPLDECDPLSFDVVINCTPVGMHPNVDATPLALAERPSTSTTYEKPSASSQTPDPRPQTLVFDTIYNPAETRPVAGGEGRGMHDGIGRGDVCAPGRGPVRVVDRTGGAAERVP